MTDEELTSEQLQAGTDVAGAAVQAAEAEKTPAKARTAASRAARSAAKNVQIELSEEQADMLANAVVAKIDERGGFDSQPEPVTAPAPPVAAGGAPAPVEHAQPRKESFAEKFRGR